ncbi:MAG: hypothetical protein ACRDIV_06410, partial [Ktedonobacteraceae bacterium]
WGCDHDASRNPGASGCQPDKHKAPTPLHIRPLSLQDEEASSLLSSFPSSVVKVHQDGETPFPDFD